MKEGIVRVTAGRPLACGLRSVTAEHQLSCWFFFEQVKRGRHEFIIRVIVHKGFLFCFYWSVIHKGIFFCFLLWCHHRFQKVFFCVSEHWFPQAVVSSLRVFRSDLTILFDCDCSRDAVLSARVFRSVLNSTVQLFIKAKLAMQISLWHFIGTRSIMFKFISKVPFNKVCWLVAINFLKHSKSL